MTPQELRAIIDHGYQILRKEEEGVRFPFRGSGLGSCLRQLALDAAGVPKLTLPGKRIRTFMNGTDSGERQARALKYGLMAHSEPEEVIYELPVYVPLPLEEQEGLEIIKRIGALNLREEHEGLCTSFGGPMLVFHCDLVATYRDSVALLIEFKTKHSFGYNKLTEEGIDGGYALQVAGQLRGLRRMGFSVPAAYVVYENKDNQELEAVQAVNLVETRWLPSDAEFDARILAFTDALRAWARGDAYGVAPDYQPRADGALPWPCHYCSIGPEVGQCFAPRKVKNVAPNADVPRWRVFA